MCLLQRTNKGYLGGLILLAGFVVLIMLVMTNNAPAAQTPSLSPNVAGKFYPSDPGVLANQVDSYLREARQTVMRVDGDIFGLMVPHAGYAYSGKMAAAGYSQIKGKPYKTIILMGGSHFISFDGISIFPMGFWETPLGNVTIDEKITRKIMESCPFVKHRQDAFLREHSLEVQLPFLIWSLADFKVVPLVIGKMGEEDYRRLADTLTKLLRQEKGAILLVASSDMSHFHNYEDASGMDRRTLGLIGKLDYLALIREMKAGACELCGSQAVITLLMVAQKMKGKPTVLGYTNSGDVVPDKSRVVGYGSVAFSVPSVKGNKKGSGGQAVSAGGKMIHTVYSESQKKALLALARDAIEGYVTSGKAMEVDVRDNRLLEMRGAFVTLKKKGQLRGCIGSLLPDKPLAKTVSQMAISACSRDPRFNPVTADELKDIHIEISVLSPLEPVADVNTIEVGTHGLLVGYEGRSGVLLPQVATERGWSREEFLRKTCIKAGISPDAWKLAGVEIYSFTAEVFGE